MSEAAVWIKLKLGQIWMSQPSVVDIDRLSITFHETLGGHVGLSDGSVIKLLKRKDLSENLAIACHEYGHVLLYEMNRAGMLVYSKETFQRGDPLDELAVQLMAYQALDYARGKFKTGDQAMFNMSCEYAKKVLVERYIPGVGGIEMVKRKANSIKRAFVGRPPFAMPTFLGIALSDLEHGLFEPSHDNRKVIETSGGSRRY